MSGKSPSSAATQAVDFYQKLVIAEVNAVIAKVSTIPHNQSGLVLNLNPIDDDADYHSDDGIYEN